MWDVLEDEQPVGNHVVIIDDGEGGWKGIGLALQLQSEGHQVEMITPLPFVGAKLGPFSANLAVPRVHKSGMTYTPVHHGDRRERAHRADHRNRADPAPSPASIP